MNIENISQETIDHLNDLCGQFVAQHAGFVVDYMETNLKRGDFFEFATMPKAIGISAAMFCKEMGKMNGITQDALVKAVMDSFAEEIRRKDVH
jgi:hypothetical protein